MSDLADKFEHKMRTSSPGEVIVYHTGFLMEDRKDDEAAKEIGERAFKLYLEGYCVLLQKKLRGFNQTGDQPPLYEYRAMRRSRQ